MDKANLSYSMASNHQDCFVVVGCQRRESLLPFRIGLLEEDAKKKLLIPSAANLFATLINDTSMSFEPSLEELSKENL